MGSLLEDRVGCAALGIARWIRSGSFRAIRLIAGVALASGPVEGEEWCAIDQSPISRTDLVQRLFTILRIERSLSLESATG